MDVLIPVNASIGEFRLDPVMTQELLAGPTSPRLHISRVGADVQLSWVKTAEGFLLEQADRLDPGNVSWTEPTAQYATNGVWIEVSLPAAQSAAFYRLAKPAPVAER